MNAFVKKYKTALKSKNKMKVDYDDIRATEGYVRYSLDIFEMNKLLNTTKDFNLKMDLLICLEVAERKRTWHIKHPNFDSKRANFLFNVAKNAPKI